MISKKLFEILKDVQIVDRQGEDIPVMGLQIDSRKVTQGDVYVAIKGHNSDGHDYVQDALDRGAAAVVVEYCIDEIGGDVTMIVVKNTRLAVAQMVKVFFGDPSSVVKVIGVTGTNGKSTIVFLLHQLFRQLGVKAGLISTIINDFGSGTEESTHTTPDVINLNRLLARMRDAGCDYAFIEVSSHALDQGRVGGVRFAGAVFTNLSHDHLGYHGGYKEYIAAKQKLFTGLTKEAFALMNHDDPKSEIMIERSKANIWNYGLKSMVDYRCRILENSINGLGLVLDGSNFHSILCGKYNAYNLAATYGVARLLGFEKDEVLEKLSIVKGAPGRFEIVADIEKEIYGIVDYAHTPDALEKVLKNAADVRTKGMKLITVVGCGGNRDKTKRPIMARIAAKNSDLVILTSDNPRNEDPEIILDEMMSGIPENERDNVYRITDRTEAIRMATRLATKRAIILIAGKGHETYQEIKGKKLPFDDLEKIKTTLFKDI